MAQGYHLEGYAMRAKHRQEFLFLATEEEPVGLLISLLLRTRPGFFERSSDSSIVPYGGAEAWQFDRNRHGR
jgi:hypothetical protein